MTVYLTLISGNDLILHLVSDFARGLGCAVDVVPEHPARGIRIEVPDAGQGLVEPLCQLTYRHAGACAEVRLAVRIAEFSIEAASVSNASRAPMV